MSYLVFAIFFIYITNFFQINKLIGQFGREHKAGKKVRDEFISRIVEKNTGVKIDYFLLFDDKKMFGMMPGFPPLKPNMILSKKLYEGFNKEELEWVVTHEVGHYVLFHTIKFGIALLIFLVLGCYLINIFNVTNLILVLVLAIILGLIYVQIARVFEREVDTFAARKISNPKGMISGNEKLVKNNVRNRFYELRRNLLGWNVLPDERDTIAEKELIRRK